MIRRGSICCCSQKLHLQHRSLTISVTSPLFMVLTFCILNFFNFFWAHSGYGPSAHTKIAWRRFCPWPECPITLPFTARFSSLLILCSKLTDGTHPGAIICSQTAVSEAISDIPHIAVVSGLLLLDCFLSFSAGLASIFATLFRPSGPFLLLGRCHCSFYLNISKMPFVIHR